MKQVQVQVVDGKAIVKAEFGVGKVFDPRLPENQNSLHIPPNVKGMIRFYEHLFCDDGMSPQARKENIDNYKTFVMLDALGMKEAALSFDSEGNLQGFRNDVEVIVAEPEFYSMRLFIWDYHPRRRGNDQREVTCNITEFYTSKETARRRYDELKRRFDFETSHHNTYGFIRLAEADHRNDGQLFEGYKVVDGCEAEAKR